MPIIYDSAGNSKNVDSWMLPVMRGKGWSTTPPHFAESQAKKSGKAAPRTSGRVAKRTSMFQQNEIVQERVDLSTARSAKEMAAEARQRRIDRAERLGALNDPEQGPLVQDIGGMLKATVGGLPFGIGERIMGNWQAQELGLQNAAPKLERMIQGTMPFANNVSVEELRLQGYTTSGKPIYEVDITGSTAAGPFSHRTELRMDSNQDVFIPREVPATGDTLLDPGGGSELTQADFNELMGNDKVARAMAAFEQGTLGEAGDILSGQLELIDRITAATGLSMEQAQDFLAMSAAAVVGDQTVLPPEGFFEDDPAPAIDYDAMYGFGGGGSGGGGTKAEFVPSDPGLVADWVRNLLVALVGVADDVRVQQLVSIFTHDERAAYDNVAVDPKQSVRERIREFGDYKAIHRLRPANIQEEQWIGRQFAPMEQAGVRLSSLTDRAILQAQVGVSSARAGEAASLSELTGTGRALPSFMQQMEKVATDTFRRIN